MAASLSGVFSVQQFTDIGGPLVGGRLYTYGPSTTTLKIAYTDEAGTIPHTYTSDGIGGQYIALDARGELPAGLFLLAGGYDLALKTAAGATIWTRRAIGADARAYTDSKFAELAGLNGATMVGFRVGTTTRLLSDKLLDDLTVEDFGAVGNGVTSDAPAFLQMATATGGLIRMMAKEYLIGQLNLPDFDRLVIVGKGMPGATVAADSLKTGTVLLGGIAARANTVHVQDFGLDNGSARALVGVVDGLVLNAKVGEAGADACILNVASLGPTPAGTTHAILVQGFSRGRADNIYCGKHQFGLVVKSRNFEISNVTGDDLRTALVYPKSDVPASAGDVGSGVANSFEISNVRHTAGTANTEASAVYLHASTAAFASARVVNVAQTYGLAALRIQGGGAISDPTISGVRAANIRAEAAQQAVYVGGYTYDWSVKNSEAINPKTGRAVYMDGNAFGWSLDGVHVTISDNTIVGDIVFQSFGEGTWDNVTVRNPYLTMRVHQTWNVLSTVKTGKISGQCRNTYDADLTPANGAAADVAPAVPRMRILPGSVMKLEGRFNMTAAANKFFCNLPVSTGRQIVFGCAGIDSAGTNYVAATVRLNDGQLSVETPAYGTLSRVDVSNITVAL